jgi:hypothetical protein
VVEGAKEGRDIRALTAMLDRIYRESAPLVEEPHSFAELNRLTSEELRALQLQWERQGKAKPFRADEWRTAREEERRTMLEQFEKLTRKDRLTLLEKLNELEAKHQAEREAWHRKYPGLTTPIFDLDN